MAALARQRLWLAALGLYAAAGLADMSVHLVTEHKNSDSTGPYYLPVAFAAGLFWPADLVAQILLAR